MTKPRTLVACLIALCGCVHLEPLPTGITRTVERSRSAKHVSFETVSTPTPADPAYRFRLKQFRLKKVAYEREVEPEIRLTKAGCTVSATAWLATLGAGLYLAVRGQRFGDEADRRAGTALLYTSDGLLAGTLGFRFLVHGRKLDRRWSLVKDSEQSAVDSVEAVSGVPVTLVVGGAAAEKRIPYVTDGEGAVTIPVGDLEPFLESQGAARAKLVYEGDPKASTSFALRSMVAQAVTLTLQRPEEEPARVDDEVTEIVGMAADPAGLGSLRIVVNGKKQWEHAVKDQRKEYSFSRPILLAPGFNVVRIRAVGRSGTTEKVVHIERQIEPPKQFAVVIGVSRYLTLPPSKYAADDAKAVGDLMVRNGWVALNDLVLLTDEEATLGRVRDLLAVRMVKRVTPNDDVWVYFAGHGAVERDRAGLDPDGFSKYLALFDTQPDALYSTALPMEELARIGERLPAKNVVFVLDTCYSGGGGRTITASAYPLSSGFLTRLAAPRGRMVLSSSGPWETSRDEPKSGHGLFTAVLLEGLKGKPDRNGDGLMTMAEIHAWVSDAVRMRTDDRQNPMIYGRSPFALRVVR